MSPDDDVLQSVLLHTIALVVIIVPTSYSIQ